MLLYPMGRILVELQRPDAWRIAGIPTAQWVAGGLILLSLFLLWYRRRAVLAAMSAGGRSQARHGA